MYATFITVFLFMGSVCGNEADFRVIDSIKYEQPCLSMGGLCTIAADCPKGLLAKPGACPTQRKLGVECCYGISVKETRCTRLGGDCVDKSEDCNPELIKKNVTDCPTNSQCCVYVR